jgi:hypothetical protein
VLFAHVTLPLHLPWALEHSPTPPEKKTQTYIYIDCKVRNSLHAGGIVNTIFGLQKYNFFIYMNCILSTPGLNQPVERKYPGVPRMRELFSLQRLVILLTDNDTAKS